MTNNIPASFELMGEKWTVQYNVNPANGDEMGECDHSQNKITLQVRHTGIEIPATKIEGTYYHELAHAILGMGCYDKLCGNEQLVQFIGGCLHQYMKTAKFEKEDA